MRYSKLFGRTVKTVPSDEKIISNRLLYQGGFIRESTAGRYFFLPLGVRVQQKIMHVVKEEMDRAGAQEMIAPVLHPLELWKETNRTKTTGFELMVIKDRRKAEFALGGTAEEMFVDVVRKFQLSYRDLPFNIYQFSTKFRDELRARGGLLRVREFIMKDAYSFHADEVDFKKEYANMSHSYSRIFERLGLKTAIVESDNGYIGGEYCHEFIVESDVGESKFLMTEDGRYAAHIDVAKFKVENIKSDEDEKPLQEVEGKGIIGVAELAKYLDIPVEKTTKTILFEDGEGNVIAAAVRGDLDVNEVKLLHVANVHSLKLASVETIKRVTGADVGYAGILNLPKEVQIFMDESLAGRVNFEMGANRTNYHSVNVNFGRDLPLPEQFYDIRLAKEGYESMNGGKLIEKKGIEVGNIFQLGYHYTNLMRDAMYVDEDGTQKKYYMGCYGIGIGRTLATIVEQYHDQRGIAWPEVVAPFKIHLVGLNLESDTIKKRVEEIYETLENVCANDVLFDDRVDVSAGAKFADCDLIGCPYRIVVSVKTGDKIEVKKRTEKESKLMSVEEFVTSMQK